MAAGWLDNEAAVDVTFLAVSVEIEIEIEIEIERDLYSLTLGGGERSENERLSLSLIAVLELPLGWILVWSNPSENASKIFKNPPYLDPSCRATGVVPGCHKMSITKFFGYKRCRLY